jgi:thiol-disulfide isomerase/thioredoxin
MPPHLQPADHLEYRDYLEAPDHRAFAIAPGGAWGWSAGEPSAEAAETKALDDCGSHTEQQCVAYAVDGSVVFDQKAWTTLWGPYADAKGARNRRSGTMRGDRFPGLALSDAQGKPISVAALAGKVVLLHFWGTWCPPCRRELPELNKLHAAMADRSDVAFVLVQVREKFQVARDWLRREGLSLPLYDSGAHGEQDTAFRLADGGSIADRRVASRFPTTYVLDKRGLVVFSHVGPVADWRQFEPFLRDAASGSGK